MPKKVTPTCEETADGYLLGNTIMSKRYYQKGVLKGKWNPETRKWLVPLKAATSAEELVRKYMAASYDPGSTAAYHAEKNRQRSASSRRQRQKFKNARQGSER